MTYLSNWAILSSLDMAADESIFVIFQRMVIWRLAALLRMRLEKNTGQYWLSPGSGRSGNDFCSDSPVGVNLQQQGVLTSSVNDVQFADSRFECFQCGFDLGNHSG